MKQSSLVVLKKIFIKSGFQKHASFVNSPLHTHLTVDLVGAGSYVDLLFKLNILIECRVLLIRYHVRRESVYLKHRDAVTP